jgi:hypothetical protein
MALYLLSTVEGLLAWRKESHGETEQVARGELTSLIKPLPGETTNPSIYEWNCPFLKAGPHDSQLPKAPFPITI